LHLLLRSPRPFRDNGPAIQCSGAPSRRAEPGSVSGAGRQLIGLTCSTRSGKEN
jgi:hypothetical protein